MRQIGWESGSIIRRRNITTCCTDSIYLLKILFLTCANIFSVATIHMQLAFVTTNSSTPPTRLPEEGGLMR